MKQKQCHSFWFLIALAILCVLFLTSCGSNFNQQMTHASPTQQNATEQFTAENNIVVSPSTTVQSTDTPTQYQTLDVTSTAPLDDDDQIIAQSTGIALTLPQTQTLIPSPTYTVTSLPIVTPIPCDNSGLSPDKAPVWLDVNINSSHIVVEQPYMYLATERYIGLFDISDPVNPQFFGFWELPVLSEVSSLAVRNGVVYITNGDTLYILNSSEQCRFAIMAQVKLPFTISKLIMDGNKMYIGGIIGEPHQIQVVTLILASPIEPIMSGIVSLGDHSFTWSVFGETLYWIAGDEFYKAVFSLTDKIEPQLIDVSLDPEVIANSWFTILDNDDVYLFSGISGLTIVQNLGSDSPVISHHIAGNPFIGVVQVQENYLFLGDNGCDATQCNAVVEIRDTSNGDLVFVSGLWPYYPVTQYIKLQDNLIYAFTENSPLVKDALLVVDISDVNEAVIIHWVALIT